MPTTKAAVMVIERENGDCVMVDSLRKEGANKQGTRQTMITAVTGCFQEPIRLLSTMQYEIMRCLRRRRH